MRAMLRFEFVLSKHQIEAVDRRLFERKPSKPKEDSKDWGGERVIGSERKTMSGDLEEIRWRRALRVGGVSNTPTVPEKDFDH